MNEMSFSHAMPAKDMIDHAIRTWQAYNTGKTRWAAFEVAAIGREVVAAIKWGFIHTDGTKEVAIETITYRRRHDGSVVTSSVVHP